MALVSQFTASMLDRGTKSMSRQQLKDEFDRLKARVNVFGAGGQVNVSVQTTKDNLPAVMKIVADVLKNPAFSEKEFEELRNEQLAGIEEQKSDPQALASNALSRHLNPYPKDDIRYVMTLEEEIEAIKSTKLEDIKNFMLNFMEQIIQLLQW